MAPLSASLAAYAEDLRVRWGVSALSVSLVDGRSQGFGSPTSGPMTPDTVCLIASNTKLFTAVAIGILVDQGKLSFDSKIKDLIPGFKVANEHTTEHATVADAMSHSTGCTSGNICFAFRYNNHHKDIVENICATRCSKELKQSFAYDNRWFSVMAYIIEQLSGQTYSDFVKSHILGPLDMSRSTFDPREAQSNAATPTVTLDDAKTTTDLPFWFTNAQPGNSWEGAAGLFSTSEDMAKWVGYLMRTAKAGEASSSSKIISAATLKQISTPRALCDNQLWFGGNEIGEASYPELSTPLYALAVERYQLHGIDVASHNGCMPGYGSVTLWTPNRDFGIAVVANQTHRGNAVINLIAIRAFEEHFGIKALDWEKRMLDKEAKWATGPFKLPDVDGYSAPSVELADLKGTYKAEGCPLLYIVGARDEDLPSKVQSLRNRLLEQEIFGRLAGEINLLAIWDTDEAYLADCISFVYVGHNIFLGEILKLCSTPEQRKGVLLTYSAFSPFFKPLFYAFKETDGQVKIECKCFWKDKAPKVALGEGDFTFVKVDKF